MKHYGLGREGAAAVAESLHENPFLRTLNLSDNYLCDEGATAVGRMLEHNTTLTSLDLSDNNMGWASEMVLQGVALNPYMRRIGLKGNKINDSIAHSVFDAICVSGVTAVDLSYNAIGDVGARGIGEALMGHEHIKELCLNWNSIGPFGMQSIARGIENNATLTSVSLGWNGAHGVGGTALGAAIASSKSLRFLDLTPKPPLENWAKRDTLNDF